MKDRDSAIFTVRFQIDFTERFFESISLQRDREGGTLIGTVLCWSDLEDDFRDHIFCLKIEIDRLGVIQDFDQTLGNHSFFF